MSNRRKDLILGCIILLFSILMLLESRRIPIGIIDEQVGVLASAKGFYNIVALSLALLAILLIIKTLRATSISKTDNSRKKEAAIVSREVFISMLLLVFYVSTMHIFGFFINSFILLMVTMTLYYLKEQRVNKKNKKQIRLVVLKVFVISIISLIVLQLLFGRFLKVYLPRGIFGF